MKRFLLALLLLVSLVPLFAQQKIVKEPLIRKLDSLRKQQQSRIHAYQRNGNNRQRLTGDFLLVDITPNGVPIYKAPINVNSIVTTGVDALHAGDLGITLNGEGMVVGIWDAGISEPHNELGDRIIFKEDSSNVHFHAMHVIGTILATGITPAVKGMAPLAKGISYYYDNDYEEMINEATNYPNALFLSNHSYGSVTGWVRSGGVWYWTGTPEISTVEDYRFGLYSDDAVDIDEIANLAPYYTMVWAVGNDRGDTGDGTHPPDGNQGTGYDAIIPEATAKNSIVVGATTRILDYTGPASVPMSTFSSFGPTDDGRIKPDVVANGVNVYSLNTGNGFRLLSGTSMATPNVTGSVLLIQELYQKQNAGHRMRSSTVKALAIHTAKEAGDAPGPDYRFGWGLLDVEQAAKVLLKEDGINNIVDEYQLNHNEQVSLQLTPVANKKITVTIAWTDPAGTPPGAVLDPETLMLVNDLDIRLIDPAGNEIFPWILDPSNPTAAATRGDNFRDNVEKIEFDFPEDKVYDLVIRHKGFLSTPQVFSLVITYESKASSARTFYWIGGSGSWDDTAHWSLTSGGASSLEVPGVDDYVVVDDHSFDGVNERVISLNKNEYCGKLSWITDRPGIMAFNDYFLQLSAGLKLSSSSFRTETFGALKFDGTGTIDLHKGTLDTESLYFTGGDWTINGGGVPIGGISVEDASLKITAKNIPIRNIQGWGQSTLDLRDVQIDGLVTVVFDAVNVMAEGAYFPATEVMACYLIDVDFEGTLAALPASELHLYGNAQIDSLEINAYTEIDGEHQINHLRVYPGAILSLPGGLVQEVDNIKLGDMTTSEPAQLRSSNDVHAKIKYNKSGKLCFDHLVVTGIELDTDAIFNAGSSSIVENSPGWLTIDCDQVLVPDLSVQHPCIKGVTQFTDKSIGPVTSRTWNFGDPESASNVSEGEEVVHVYTAPGIYTITLTIASELYEVVLARSIEVLPNSMMNTIVQNGFVLTSQQAAVSYQWYHNGEKIADAAGRTYLFDGSGAYTVLIAADECNYMSEPFIILDAEESLQQYCTIAPNPADREIYIHFKKDKPVHRVAIRNALGQPIMYFESTEEDVVLPVDHLANGLYILEADGQKTKVIIRH
jgi:hypothetical protein